MDKDLKTAINSIQEIFPIESKTKTLELTGLEFNDPKKSDLQTIKGLKLNDQTYGTNLYANFVLKNKNGKKISARKIKLATIPAKTPNKSFLVNGTEYVPLMQNRLKKGAYSRIKANGEIETFHNVQGTAFSTEFNPVNKKLSLKFRQAHFPIYPLLKTLGIKDSEIKALIPEEVFNKNVVRDREKLDGLVMRLHRGIVGENAGSVDEAASGVRSYFENKETDPTTTERTLGKKFATTDGKYMLRTIEKTINVVTGKEEPDSRDSLEFKETYDIADIIKDRLTNKSWQNKVRYKIRRNIDKFDDLLRIINKNDISNPINNAFTSSTFANYAKQINPMPMITEEFKVSLLGEGGISSTRRVTDEAQKLHDSSAGFLDPIHGPESDRAGVISYLSSGTKKDGHKLLRKMTNLKTGKNEWVDPATASKFGFALPGQGDDIIYVKDDKLHCGTRKDIKYEISDPLSMYDTATNSIPFLNYDSGARVLLGGKFSEHTIPLTNPDVPYVQTIDGKGNKLNKMFADLHLVNSPSDGDVISVTNKEIKIRTKDGRVSIPLIENYPLNENSILYSKVKVKAGDHVKKGQLLADSNFTVNGEFAIGKNLRVAFMPWYGLNHEDGIVITEQGANKLQSEELKEIDVLTTGDAVVDKYKFNAYFPGKVTASNADKLDNTGIIKPGETIMSGDILVTKLQNKPSTAFDSFLKKLDRSLVKPFVDSSIAWDSDDPAVVTDVVRLNDKIKIFAKSTKPIHVGDKLVFRHGSKSIVTNIIPTDEAPLDGDGKPVDIIFSPIGIPSRMNPGMILEAAAGKLSHKIGKNYYVHNFDGKDHAAEIKKGLADNNINEKEDLTIPKYNKTIPQVFVGNSYVTRLKQTAERQSSARSYGDFYDSDMQAGSGGGGGGQSVGGLLQNALLAYNAKENLYEMSRIKGQSNLDYWRAVESGLNPVEPERPFVYTKFENQLKQMGINVRELNKKKRLAPLTDEDILNLSAGAIRDATNIARAKDLQPNKDGLFGKEAEGYSGEVWNHIDLAAVLPRPAFETVIQKALKISPKEYDEILSGNKIIKIEV